MTSNLSEIIASNPIVESLFLGLKDTKHAMLFWCYFIIRRFTVSAIAAFLGGYQAI